MSVIKHFAGANPQKKKGFPKRQKVTPKYPGRGSVKLPDKKPMPRKPLPMPYYPETSSNKRPDVYAPGRPSHEEFRNKLIDAYPGGTHQNTLYTNKKQVKVTEGMKNLIASEIKAWEDRNRSNNKTKLNP